MKSINKKIEASIVGSGYGNYVILESLNQLKYIKKKIMFGRNIVKLKKIFNSGKVDEVFKLNENIFKIKNNLNKKDNLLCLATIPGYQYEILKKININQFKYYFLEKPVADNFANCKKLYKKFKKINSRVAVDFIFLGLKSFKYFKKLINLKKINNVEIKWHFNAHHFKYQNLDTWKKKTKFGGGIYFYYMIHIISYINYFFGRVKKVKKKIEITNTKKDLVGANLDLICNNQIKISLDFNSNSRDNVHSIKVYTNKEVMHLVNTSTDYVKNFKIFSFKNKKKLKRYFFLSKSLIKLDSRVEPVINLLNRLMMKKKPVSTILDAFNASCDLQKIIKKNVTK